MDVFCISRPQGLSAISRWFQICSIIMTWIYVSLTAVKIAITSFQTWGKGSNRAIGIAFKHKRAASLDMKGYGEKKRKYQQVRIHLSPIFSWENSVHSTTVGNVPEKPQGGDFSGFRGYVYIYEHCHECLRGSTISDIQIHIPYHKKIN